MELAESATALFEQLRSSSAHPSVVEWLWSVATTGTDLDGFKVNPFRVARALDIDRVTATRAFLFATRLGVTDLTWDIHCPSCLAVPEYYKHLMDLGAQAHCALCGLRFDLSFEDQIEATFTLNSNVRPIDLAQFRECSWPADRETVFRRFSRDGRLPLAGVSLVPDGTAVLRLTLAEGEYLYQLPGDPGGAGVATVEGPEAADEQTVRLAVVDGGLDVRRVTVRPGPLRVEITCGAARRGWGIHLRPVGPAHDWVSAAYLTSLQDFRDLFGGEFLAADRSFAIRSATLLFTDITGSTEMYERLGDAQAFALVQKHFELMTEVIRRREGGIVKTIGDAVMAAFPKNVDAVLAALEIQDGFATVAEPLRQITVKIGLHRGPTIAVTSNRMLDYFGRTVNIAARVQGASESGEILVSETVLSDPLVSRLVATRGLTAERRDAKMKGIAGTVPVFSLRRP